MGITEKKNTGKLTMTRYTMITLTVERTQQDTRTNHHEKEKTQLLQWWICQQTPTRNETNKYHQ